ncbi:MAG: glycosyl transferase family 1 [Chloroflexota bacterium]
MLQVYKDFHPVPGGIEGHIRDLTTRLRALGVDASVLVTSPDRCTRRETLFGVPVTKAGRLGQLASTPISFRLCLELWRSEADIYHLHFPYPLGELAYLLRPRGRLVITYHSDIVRQRTLLRLYRPLLGRLLQRADLILVTSPQYLESSTFLRPVAGKCRVVPLGIDLGRFDAFDPERVAAWRAKLGKPLVLFVGRFRYYKGLDYLVEALRLVPEARLALVGDGPEGPRLRRLVADYGLGSRVAFLGVLPDEELPAVYRAADVYVLPATERSEAFGISLLEAMAAGLPVVTTELGTGTSYVNRHGETGLIVPPRNPGALAAALAGLLADPERRRALGVAGRRRVEAEFTLDRMVGEVLRVYREVLGR